MSSKSFLFSVKPDGTIEMIYDDEAADFFAEAGHLSITRASHVEPDEAGKWWAHMVGEDVKLGPYDLRQTALDAEREYLEAKLFGDSKCL